MDLELRVGVENGPVRWAGETFWDDAGWLNALPLSNPSKDKWRHVMSIVYREAQTYGMVPRSESSNPVKSVKQSAKPRYRPVVLDPATAAKTVAELAGMERVLVVLVAGTGCRISEALGLKWGDLDFEARQINLRRTWVHERAYARLKTSESEGPVPLPDLLAEVLLAWKVETMYGESNDWVFASTKTKGRTPRSGSILTADHLRPAALRAGVKLADGQRFGFHNLRHSLATFLVNAGTDVKTVQSLLRHANVSTTLGLYAHRVDGTMMAAAERMMQAMRPKTDAVN